MYDNRCAELAGVFITDCLKDSGQEAPADKVASLAQAIQDTIEEWLDDNGYYEDRDTLRP